MIATGVVLAASITLLVAFGTALWTAMLCVSFWGFAFGMLPVTIQIFVLSSAPDHPETAAATLVSTIQISIGVGSLIGGLTADDFGVVSALWLGAGAAALAAVILFVLNPRSVRQVDCLRHR